MLEKFSEIINRNIFWFFILAIVLRLIILLPYYSGDVNNHIAWGKSLVEEGFVGFYQRDFGAINIAFPTYGPIGMLPFAATYLLFDMTTKLVWNFNLAFPLFPSNLVHIFNFDNRNLLAAYLKLPAIVGDVLVGLFIFLFAKNILKVKKPHLFAVFYLFNPAVFYLSANWGQIDSLPLAFTLGAFYFLFQKKPILSFAFITFALLTKQTAVLFLPIFVISFFANYGPIKFIKSVLAAILVFWFFYLPFFVKSPLLPFKFYITTYSYITNRVYANAFNFWYFIFPANQPFDSNSFLGLSYQLWGIVLFLVFASPLLLLVTQKNNPKSIILASAYVLLVSFLFQTRIHERYLAFSLPFLLLSASAFPNLLFGYLLISIIHIVNLYNGFFQPNISLLTNLLSRQLFTRFLIATNFAVFSYLFVKVIESGFNLNWFKKNGKT